MSEFTVSANSAMATPDCNLIRWGNREYALMPTDVEVEKVLQMARQFEAEDSHDREAREHFVPGEPELVEFSDTLSKKQRRRTVLLQAAREALVGPQPIAEAGLLHGPVKGRAVPAAAYDLVYVTAFLEKGWQEAFGSEAAVVIDEAETLLEDGS